MQRTPSPVASPLPRASIVRSTAWNIAGLVTPLLVALFAIPVLIKSLGVDRFGILNLAWMLIGYFSLFDLGIGRALTKLVAERLGEGRHADVPGLVWMALSLMLALGVIGAVVMAALSPWLTRDVLEMPIEYREEARNTFLVLAISLPVVISTSALRGVLEAYQRFDLVNLIRIPFGVFMFVGPLFVLPFTRNLTVVVAVLMLGRIVSWVAHYRACLSVAPELRAGRSAKLEAAGPLLRFGSWMSVSNLLGPVMVYLDRFVIGAMLTTAAVAYYTTPYEIVTKLWIVPGAVLGGLFPALAATLVADRQAAVALFERGANAVLVLVFPAALLLVAFAPEGLTLWLGPDFAAHSAAAGSWLAVGVFVNCLGHVAFALVQAAGRPDVTAKLHLIELPMYLALLAWLLPRNGIVGAAQAWAIRALVDTSLLFLLAQRYVGRGRALRNFVLAMLFSLSAFGLAVLPDHAYARGAMVCVLLLVFGALAWRVLLAPADRSFALARLDAALRFARRGKQ
ncbi:flippase [Uliginosibacterium sp. H1]|uniref:flippase n=1 Tax=Uliginosibacterium sp. H1 TaxID=3114757 RepID=UPI002E186A48|nr:flippase [Uliginosibacterium sp. H1]